MTRTERYLILCGVMMLITGAMLGWQTIKATKLQEELQALQTQKDEYFSRDPKINKLYCHPIRTETERATNEWYLRKERYHVVHAMELERAFETRSRGETELIDQTNLECFYERWVTQKIPAHTYYERKLPKPKGVK